MSLCDVYSCFISHRGIIFCHSWSIYRPYQLALIPDVRLPANPAQLANKPPHVAPVFYKEIGAGMRTRSAMAYVMIHIEFSLWVEPV